MLEIVGYGYILSLPAWCTKRKMDIPCLGQNHRSSCDGFKTLLQILWHFSHEEVDSHFPLLVYGVAIVTYF